MRIIRIIVLSSCDVLHFILLIVIFNSKQKAKNFPQTNFFQNKTIWIYFWISNEKILVKKTFSNPTYGFSNVFFYFYIQELYSITLYNKTCLISI